MKVKKKACPECGERFIPKTQWQVYNKAKCRQSAYLKRVREVLVRAKAAGIGL